MPDWAPHVRARLGSLRLSPTREAEIVDELSQHLNDRYRELIAGGASPEEATGLALAEFQRGNVLAQQMSSLRQARVTAPMTLAAPTGHVLDDLWHDLRYAARIFRKQPAFAAPAVLTLALGIGATTAIFSVVYGVLIKPLPYPDSEALVSVWNTSHASDDPGQVPLSATQFFTYRDENRSFAAFGLWSSGTASVVGSPEPEEIETLQVTHGTLQALGVPPAIGRWFSPEDDEPGAAESVILADAYWKRRYGVDLSVIGRSRRTSFARLQAALAWRAPPLSTGCRLAEP